MHRIPIHQRHFRSGWLWSAAGVLVVVGAVIWAVRPEPGHCEATGTPSAATTSARTAVTSTFITSAVPAPEPPPGLVIDGEARYYSFSQGVACSFRGLPLDGFYVGMSTPEYGRADPCGGYLDIHGPHGDVRALIVDRCPGCAAGQLDLSASAFRQVADPSDGVAKIRYHIVRDPEPPPEVMYEVKPDVTSNWFAMLVSGTGNPIGQVAIRSGNGPWRDLTRGMDNYWTTTGAGPGPFTALVTDVHGNRAEIPGVALEPGIKATGARLYPDATPPPPLVPSTTTVAPTPQPVSTGTDVLTGCKP